METYFQAFLDALREQQTYSPGTLTSYLGDLRKGWQIMSQVAGKPITLDDLSPDLVSAMIQEEIRAGRKRSTIQRRIASWRAFVRFLQRQGHLPEDKVVLPDRQTLAALWEEAQGPEAAQCLNSEQLRRLWETLRRSTHRRAVRDLAIIALIAEWGFPSQTVISLRVEDVDLERRMLYVPRPLLGLAEFPLKASYGPLLRYLTQGRQEFNPAPGEYALFISQLGRALSRQGVWQLVQGWGQEAELEVKLTPRILRNTAVYRLILQGTPMERIQAALGHANAISTAILVRRLRRVCASVPPPLLPVEPEA